MACIPVPTTREGGSESGGISSDLVQGARSAAGALSDDEMATPSQVCGCRRPAGICVGTVTFRSGSDIAIGSRGTAAAAMSVRDSEHVVQRTDDRHPSSSVLHRAMGRGSSAEN